MEYNKRFNQKAKKTAKECNVLESKPARKGMLQRYKTYHYRFGRLEERMKNKIENFGSSNTSKQYYSSPKTFNIQLYNRLNQNKQRNK